MPKTKPVKYSVGVYIPSAKYSPSRTYTVAARSEDEAKRKAVERHLRKYPTYARAYGLDEFSAYIKSAGEDNPSPGRKSSSAGGRGNPDYTRFGPGEGGGRLLKYIVTDGDKVVFQSDNHAEARLKYERLLLHGEDAALWSREKSTPGLKTILYKKIEERLASGERENPASGIKFVYGILGEGDKRWSEVQSVLFDRASYTVAQAKKWLQSHGFRYGVVDKGGPRAEYLRFRQQDPGKYHTMRTGEPGAKNPSGELHLYKPLLRPVGYRTVPDGWEYVEAPMEVAIRRPDLPLSRHQFGVIGYSRQLTEEDKRDFDLEYLGTGRVGRRNPNSGSESQSASALYESFHGAPSTGSTVIEEEVRYHGELAEIGALIELKVNTLSGYQATLNFDGDPPILCSSPDRKQLYLRGGDQGLDLRGLHMDGPKWERDSMVIGVLDELTYRTRKGFDKMKLHDYFHSLGEDSGVQPMLIYDRMNHLLSVSGGQYKAKREGLVN